MWTRALAALPDPAQDALRLGYVAARVTSDRRSLRTYARLRRAHWDGSPSVARLRMRALGGREVLVRPGSSDLATVWGAFARRYHLPPPELGTPGTIWDLGANIGLTVADFACRFPRARVLGVELDQENVALARRNTAPWADRCQVLHAAIWVADGEVRYQGWPGATSNYRLTGTGEGTPVPAVSLASLLREQDGGVDYVKVDVEGTERELLRDGAGWAEQVRCVKVELHGDYRVADCEADLRRLGYGTRRDAQHPACVIGLRPW